MKISKLIAGLLLAMSGIAFAADEHGHDHKPLHGGIVAESGEMEFELVAKPDGITLHVRDNGKPASSKGATGKVTLLNGTEKTEAALAPAGDDKLEAKGSFKVGPGTKVVAAVNLAGKKPVNLRYAIK